MLGIVLAHVHPRSENKLFGKWVSRKQLFPLQLTPVICVLLLKNPSSFPSFACPVFDWRMSAELYNEALILYLLLDPRFKYVYASATHKFLALVLDLNPTYHIYSVSPCLVSQQRQDPSAYEPLERHPSYL